MPFKPGNQEYRKRAEKRSLGVVLRTVADPRYEEVCRTLVNLAAEGDTQAISLLLSRLAPAPKVAPVTLPAFSDAKDPASKAEVVLQAVAAGEVAPDTGKMLLDLISSQAGLAEIHEIKAAVDALREAIDGGAKSIGA